MCVKMNEDIAEIIAAEILKRFGKFEVVWEVCLITAEIQPQKMDNDYCLVKLPRPETDTLIAWGREGDDW